MEFKTLYTQKIMDTLKRIRYIIGFIPVFWIFLFVIYISFPTNPIIWKLTFIMFFVAFYTIWIYLFLTLIVIFLGKKNIFINAGTFFSLFGIILLILIIIYNPWGYLYLLLD